MNRVKFFKKFLMPCGLCAAVPVVKPASPPPDCPVDCSKDSARKTLIRPSELPIYSLEEICAKEIPCPDDCPPTFLEQGFGVIRRAVQDVLVEVNVVNDKVSDTVNTGLEHSQLMLDYLQQENSTLPRLGAVSVGGLTGLILGLRGGKFKKLVYTSTGALTMAAVCYPRQAQEGVDLVKHYVNISYNFVYGIKPGDNDQLQISWPELPKLKLPTNLSEITELAVDTGSAAVELVSSLAGKAKEILSNEENKQSEASKPKDQ
ncbi:MICOS complex subunit MIC27 [Orussus abietinus]|uniref:MICOS complex subunit MIC27 n=1 Tax=Orussus abietinus TaxID=222816 RepID=UPI000626A5CF|nr:MICOS complex subunit MIC27 [Orussus abietinus]